MWITPSYIRSVRATSTCRRIASHSYYNSLCAIHETCSFHLSNYVNLYNKGNVQRLRLNLIRYTRAIWKTIKYSISIWISRILIRNSIWVDIPSLCRHFILRPQFPLAGSYGCLEQIMSAIPKLLRNVRPYLSNRRNKIISLNEARHISSWHVGIYHWSFCKT
jgi:hypothetical protein